MPDFGVALNFLWWALTTVPSAQNVDYHRELSQRGFGHATPLST